MSEIDFDPDEILPPGDAEPLLCGEPSDQRDGDGGDEDRGGRRRSDATTVVELALERFTLCVDEDGMVFAIPVGGPSIAVELRGSRLSLPAALSAAFFDRYGRAVSSSAIADAMKVLEGRGQRLEPTKVHLRSAQVGERVLIDLGHQDGRAIEVSPRGWKVVAQAPVVFRRSALSQPMPIPEEGGSVDALWEVLNVGEDDRVPLIAWLVTTFMSDLQCPALVLTGEQGAGKSWAARTLVGLVDPITPQLRRPPSSDQDWPSIMRASRVVALDNLSTVSAGMSDMLCRAVTGDGDVKRQLYSESLIPYAYKRALVLNGISLGVLRGDLAERILLCELRTIDPTQRRIEAELREAVARAQPRILGALLSILAGVLDVWPTVDLDRYPRMAEFARVLACVDRILGTDGLARYEERVQRGVADVAGNDPVSRALQAKIRGPWTGSAAALLSAIECGKPDGYEARFWPTSPQALTGQVRRIAPALRAAGWQVTEDFDRHKKRTEWTLVPPQDQQGEDADDQW